MIEIKNLFKSYDNIQVLKDISMSIPKGKIYGIIGRSGTGKSTLLRCINGLETYQSGSLIVEGIDVQTLSGIHLRQFRKEVGMIFQQFSLLSRLTVYENIALPLKGWRYDNNYIENKVKYLLEMVGLQDKANSMTRELSGGQKQRVAIARALTMNPKILLCDEATSALDPKTANSIINLLNQINRELGITIIMVTHQMSVLQASCEEMVILEDGMVAEKGNVEQIFLQQPPALKSLIGEKDLLVHNKGITLKIMLSNEHSDTPIITQMAQDLKTNFIILGGEMDRFREHILGSVMINISSESLESVQNYLNSRQVVWNIVSSAEGGRD
ncbi:methionine ABC transporter ATP-binding protein [Clostridium sp. OS1-26]|uniref:methionine ABC transporter ATP-binding protein n=1 Tax=Clostridium sp. OS1-26 TaxID=3070681 RepID=UPI0027DFD9E3|nr:methionine ABC transporter ATP-binding protein [Clostridium sp. OS1-26]WML35549.1 methionine ABC transporter ATP-binding protein [Clostridium sp. OS1-26]